MASNLAEVVSRLEREVRALKSDRSRRGHAHNLMDIVYFDSPGSHTFKRLAYPGLRAVLVKVQAGGGAGGGRDGNVGGAAAGGGGGGYGEKFVLASELSDAETVAVGSGGAGVNMGNGNSGGGSSFGAFLSANGGGGGTKNGGLNSTRNGGSGGTVSGADFARRGQDGDDARTDSNIGGIAEGIAGDGGDSFLGSGAPGNPAGQTGGGAHANAGPGGGGSGANGSTGQNAAGGNGADGIVIVELYF